MLTRSDLYEYQGEAVDHILSRNGSMLWLDVGLGKTIVSLTAIEQLLDEYKIRSALVMAPKRVVEAVWRQEAEGWEHTGWLKFSAIHGGLKPKERLRELHRRADVYLANYEQIEWLVGRWVTEMYVNKKGRKTSRRVFSPGVLFKEFLDKNKRLPFDAVVFDEISKMKTATGVRSRAFQKILPEFRYRIGLTGTPAANGYLDLHGQFLMIDGGKRLGPGITSYKNRWFLPNPYTMKEDLRRGAKEEIRGLIQDVTIEMSAEDYVKLPPLLTQDITLEFDSDTAKRYKEFEREFFLTLDDGDIEAFNAGAKSTKCRQLANGAVYVGDDRTKWTAFHAAKLEATEDLITELNGKPLIICYQFRHDKERLMMAFPDAVAFESGNTEEVVDKWNKGQIRVLIGHPASMGHGLNLQKGGNHILWFGLPWSLEHYDQAIGRLLRNGQKGEAVVNHRLVMHDTIEVAIAEALKSKDKTQRELREAIKRYRRSKV